MASIDLGVPNTLFRQGSDWERQILRVSGALARNMCEPMRNFRVTCSIYPSRNDLASGHLLDSEKCPPGAVGK
jgi:hypothetical protein